jgi:integrase
MASIFKRKGKGNYIIQFFDEMGCRRERSSRTTDKRAAERIAAKLESKVALRREGVVDVRRERQAKASRKALSEHFDDYHEWCRAGGQAGQSIYQKSRHLVLLAEQTSAKVLADLTPELVGRNLQAMENAGKSARTVNYRRQIIVAFMNWAVRQGRIVEHALVEVPKRDERRDRRRIRRALTAGELQSLFSAAEERGRKAWYMAAAFAGLRKSDLLALKWEDVDFDRKTITVREGKSKRVDVIPLLPELANVLQQTQNSEGEFQSHVFPGVVTDRTRKRDFERAGIPEVDSRGRVADLHCLRMTLGTMLARQGVSPQVGQKILRHADYRTTLRYYTDLGLEDTAAALALVPGAIGMVLTCPKQWGSKPQQISQQSETEPQQNPQQGEHETVRSPATDCEEIEDREFDLHAGSLVFPGDGSECKPTPKNDLCERVRIGTKQFQMSSADDMLLRQSKAGVTQLVECQLPKLNVASSNLVARSSLSPF